MNIGKPQFLHSGKWERDIVCCLCQEAVGIKSENIFNKPDAWKAPRKTAGVVMHENL